MVVTMSDGEDLMTSDQVADVLRIHKGTLRNMRLRGAGPPFFRLSDHPKGSPRYRRADVAAWITSRIAEQKTARAEE